MGSTEPRRGSTVVPCVQYRNAGAMIDWLCEVVGFERHAVYRTEDDEVAHAELTLGAGMLMVSSVRERTPSEPWTELTRHPDELDGRVETQAPSLYVQDPDAVYARVKSRGGEIVMDIEDKHYGGRGFCCRDPEGHLWSIGSYDPWNA